MQDPTPGESPPSRPPSASPLSSSAPATAKKKSSWRGKILLVLFLLIFVPLVLVGLYLAVVLNFSYSDGDRTGYLQKFSRKGWVCRTYEGELAMTTVPGVAPIVWSFSVWDETVAREINSLLGKRVVLHYREYRGIPTNCFGETDYYVDGVKSVEEPQP